MFRSVIRTHIGCIVSQENADGVVVISIRAAAKDTDSAIQKAERLLKRQFPGAQVVSLEERGERSVLLIAERHLATNEAIRIESIARSIPEPVCWRDRESACGWIRNRWIRHRLLKRLVRAMSRSTQHGAEEKRNAETQDRQPQ